jgi:hypothetical protein
MGWARHARVAPARRRRIRLTRTGVGRQAGARARHHCLGAGHDADGSRGGCQLAAAAPARRKRSGSSRPRPAPRQSGGSRCNCARQPPNLGRTRVAWHGGGQRVPWRPTASLLLLRRLHRKMTATERTVLARLLSRACAHDSIHPVLFDLSATSQRYFSVRTDQPPATSTFLSQQTLTINEQACSNHVR